MLSRARNINRGFQNICFTRLSFRVWFSNYFMCNLQHNVFMSKAFSKREGKFRVVKNLCCSLLPCFHINFHLLHVHTWNFTLIALLCKIWNCCWRKKFAVYIKFLYFVFLYKEKLLNELSQAFNVKRSWLKGLKTLENNLQLKGF